LASFWFAMAETVASQSASLLSPSARREETILMEASGETSLSKDLSFAERKGQPSRKLSQ
jgi:hypothetical protein